MTTNSTFKSTMIDNEFCTIYINNEEHNVYRYDKVTNRTVQLLPSEFVQLCRMNGIIK